MKIKKLIGKILVKIMNLYLIFDANSASCIVMNQQKVPDNLSRYKLFGKE